MSHSTPVPSPPSYSSSVDGNVTPSSTHRATSMSNMAALPAYTPRRRSTSRATSRATLREAPEMKEFPFEVKNGNGKAVSILAILAERSYSKHLPTFLQDTPITGRVSLSLEKPESIQSVVLFVRGQFLTGANPDGHFTFLELTHILWSTSDGEPRNSTTSEVGSSSIPVNTTIAPIKFAGKLQGEYIWPFSITLPKDVVLPYGKQKEPQTFSLPQTFNERYARGSINYELILRIVRGRLRTNYRISARFGYIPISRPPPFPALRRLSYQDGAPLLGPTIDPDGWYSEGPVTVKGTIFSNRIVHVGCTLCLAKPLCYTRGSLIPFFLRLESDDQQALDLLSAPQAIVVTLRRRLRYHPNPTKAAGAYSLRDTIDYSQSAVWWPSREGSEEPLGRFRFLNGELHLKPDVKPTSAMGDFRIEYSVILFPFDATGFECAEDKAFLEYPVDIVTSFAHGPRPRKFAPPGYQSDAQLAPRNFLIP